jgi:hypothetical protein
MPEPTVPDLATAAQALRDLLGAMDRVPAERVDTLAHAAAPELAVLRRWAAEATEPAEVIPCCVCRSRPEDGITGMCDVCFEDDDG